MENPAIHQYVPFFKLDTDVLLKTSTDTLKLLNPNATSLSLGDATHEGGNIIAYRDAAGNAQLTLDTDAAANEKALDVYGGVVCQNYLTVGQAALDTSYTFLVSGQGYVSGWFVLGSGSGFQTGSGGAKSWNNAAALPITIPVITPNATDHTINIQIDSNDIIVAQATGDGAGGIIGKRSIITGGQAVSKVDAGAADYNPSILTSDYIITVDTTAAIRAVTISTEDRDTGSATSPRIFIIKDIAGNAGTNAITVSLETAGTIDGAANVAINVNYDSITIMVDGTNGFVI